MLAQQIVNAAVFGSVLTLFSLGLSLAWGTLDVLNLAHGALFILAGYLAFEISGHVALPFAVLVLCCIAGSGLASTLMELTAFRYVRARFESKRQAELSFVVASIGAATIIETVINNETLGVPFAPSPNAYVVRPIHIGSVVVTNMGIVIVVVAAMMAVLMDVWVGRSSTGRAVRSIAYDAGISRLLGINVSLVASVTMFIAGGLAGLAGVLQAVNLGGEDITTGQSYMLTAFAILTIGGVGSVRGAVAGAFFVAIAETAIIAYGPSSWSNGVAFLLILVVLLIRPQGVFARKRFARA